MIKNFIASLKWGLFSKGFNDFRDGYECVCVCVCEGVVYVCMQACMCVCVCVSRQVHLQLGTTSV